MKVIGILVLSALFLSACSTDYTDEELDEIREFQKVTVYFNSGVTSEEAEEVLESYGLTWIDEYERDVVAGTVVVPFGNAMTWQERLTADEKIDYALVYVED